MSEDNTIPLKLVFTRIYNSMREWILEDVTQMIGKTIVGGKVVGGQISGKIPSTSIPNTAVSPGSYGDGTHVGAFTVGADGRLTAASNVSITHQGTVTSVGLSMPSDFTVSGSPVTSSGTLAVSANSQSANTVKAGPTSGGAAAPTYRALVNADLPSPLTISGEITGSDLVPSGLTGATAASRHVGATTSGAPASGTFLKGDWIGDQTGKRWTCTVAGSPGTWTQEPGTGGGGAPTGDTYLLQTADLGNLASAITFPGASYWQDATGRFDNTTAAGLDYEFETNTDPFTWAPSAPATHDANTTVKSSYYVNQTDTTERFGTISWSPGSGAFDARCMLHSTFETSGASVVGFLINDAGNTNRLLLQVPFQTGSSPQVYTVQAYTYTSGTYTQRGSNVNVGDVSYYRITRDGSNNISYYVSTDGVRWTLIVTQAFTLTVAGIGLRTGAANGRGYCDWLRTNV